MTPARPADRARQAVVLVAAVGQIAATFGPPLLGVGRPLGEGDADGAANPVNPPGPAFAIWGLLFPAALLYALYQAAPRRAADPLLRRVGWPTAAAFAVTAAWVALSQLVGIPPAADVAFSAAVLAGYLIALARLGPAPPRAVAAAVGLSGGWLTVALGVNVAAAVLAGGSAPPTAVAVGVVAAAGTAGMVVGRAVGGGRWYAGPVAWGLAWVAGGNLAAGGNPAVATAAGLAALLVVAAALPPARRPAVA